jgi:hypothetical protein
MSDHAEVRASDLVFVEYRPGWWNKKSFLCAILFFWGVAGTLLLVDLLFFKMMLWSEFSAFFSRYLPPVLFGKILIGCTFAYLTPMLLLALTTPSEFGRAAGRHDKLTFALSVVVIFYLLFG